MNCEHNEKFKYIIKQCFDECDQIRSKLDQLLNNNFIRPVLCKDGLYKYMAGLFDGKHVYVNMLYYKTEYDCPKLCSVTKHEIIHAVAFKKPLVVYSRFSDLLTTFYNALWKQLVDEKYYRTFARANMNVAVLTDKTDVNDKKIMTYNFELFSTFLKFIYKNKELFRSSDLYKMTLLSIDKLLTGKYPYNKVIQRIMANAYKESYGGTPIDVTFVQEFVYASEVLSVSTSIGTHKAKEVSNTIVEMI